MIHKSNIEEADDLNVPVQSFVIDPDSESPLWRWTADNYMPRKGRIEEGHFEIEADSKEEILSLVLSHVVPLYEAAVYNLTNRGENYFFAKKNPSPLDPPE